MPPPPKKRFLAPPPKHSDSHSKQLYRALQCFLIDFWPGQAECAVSASRGDVARLDDLPTRPGETKCFNVLGGGRVCQVHNVLGDSLLDNKNVSDGGVLPMLRRRFADPRDIFLVQFAAWHNKLGPPGIERMRAALKKLGEEYAVSGAKWPHLIYRESPMTHDKDAKQCLPAAPGARREKEGGVGNRYGVVHFSSACLWESLPSALAPEPLHNHRTTTSQNHYQTKRVPSQTKRGAPPNPTNQQTTARRLDLRQRDRPHLDGRRAARLAHRAALARRLPQRARARHLT